MSISRCQTDFHLAIMGMKNLEDCLGRIRTILDSRATDVNAQNEKGNTPLFLAISYEKVCIVRELLSYEANISIKNDNEEDAIFNACFWENIDIIKELFDHGASVNSQDKHGNTLLHIQEREEIVNILLERGIDVNKQNKSGDTPLHFACSMGNYEIANILLKNGANSLILNKKEKLPIHRIPWPDDRLEKLLESYMQAQEEVIKEPGYE